MSTTRVTRHFRAPRARVYHALLDPEAVQQWMVPESMTSHIHSFEAHEGGTFRISLTYDLARRPCPPPACHREVADAATAQNVAVAGATGHACGRYGGPMTQRDLGAFELPGLHHVQLAIPPGGEDLARRFYGGVLGMTELEKPPALAGRGGCWFRSGGVEVHLGVEKEFRAAAKAHPGILARNLDALAKRLEASGASVEWDANFPGHRRFYSRDLHGNRLEFLEPVE